MVSGEAHEDVVEGGRGKTDHIVVSLYIVWFEIVNLSTATNVVFLHPG